MSKGKNPSNEKESTPTNVTQKSIPKKVQKSTSTPVKHQFEPNSKYYTIFIYGLFFVLISMIIIISIAKWSSTTLIFTKFMGTLTPFIVAFFIAYILNPFVRSIDRLLKKYIYKEKHPTGRKLTAIAMSYVGVLAIITIIILYITPEIIHSMKEIESVYEKVDVTEIESNIKDTLDSLQKGHPQVDFQVIEDKINSWLPNIFNFGTDLLSSLFPLILNLSVSLVKMVINILLSIVISCYMLADKNTLSRNVKRVIYAIFKPEHATHLLATSKECNNIFSGFIIGKSIDSLIIGCICFVLMKILGLPYSMLLSVIVGITNMIPYFGPFIGAVPGVLIILFINPIQALIFAIMILALQQFDGLYLGPKILGESTGLTPLWVIFGITVGGSYGGVIGMFLGVPVVAVIAYLLNQWITNRLNNKNIEM
ncbi:permease [Lachnospiraceae bacterium KM106-2]|nr:permease [Lachnospiraceae bacterium KM106-2]